MPRAAVATAAFLLVLRSAIAEAQAPAPAPGTSNGIRVDVRGLRNSRGGVDCYLFDSAVGFPGDLGKAVKRVVAPIARTGAGTGATCRFNAVPPGAYAVAVVHDEKGTGKLERNIVGIPTNGVGVSNDAPSHFGPPSFASARFAYVGGEKTLVVHVRYLL